MARSGYSDDCDSNVCYLWDSIVTRAAKGKRGQRMLRDLAAALDAMPRKRLIKGLFQAHDGEVCALGALGVHRGVDMEDDDCWLEPEAAKAAAKAFDVAPSLAAEVMHINDDSPRETPEQRWQHVREWVDRQLVE